jgi:hypothetical protein
LRSDIIHLKIRINIHHLPAFHNALLREFTRRTNQLATKVRLVSRRDNGTFFAAGGMGAVQSTCVKGCFGESEAGLGTT